MKKLIYLIFTLLFMITSCEDNREDILYSNKVYLIKSGLQELVTTDANTSVTTGIWATKSGSESNSCVVTYKIDNAYLNEYNQQYDTEYEMLPADCYSVGQTLFNIGANDVNAQFEVVYYPAKIVELCGGYNITDKYALPVTISAEGVEVTSDNKALLIFNISKATEE